MHVFKTYTDQLKFGAVLYDLHLRNVGFTDHQT